MEYPNRLRELRKERGLSHEKLAEMINTSRGQVYNLEQGNRQLTQNWMVRLSSALNCDPADLISDRKPEAPPVEDEVWIEAEKVLDAFLSSLPKDEIKKMTRKHFIALMRQAYEDVWEQKKKNRDIFISNKAMHSYLENVLREK